MQWSSQCRCCGQSHCRRCCVLVRIYGDVVLPVTLLELLNILAGSAQGIAPHSPQQHAIQPFVYGDRMRLSTSVAARRRRCLDRLTDDDWMAFVATLPDDATFVQQYTSIDASWWRRVAPMCSAVDAADECTETLQGVFRDRVLREAFSRELQAISRNGRTLCLRVRLLRAPVIPWPGDVASRRGPLAPTRLGAHGARRAAGGASGPV
jgi:hypothetical protein